MKEELRDRPSYRLTRHFFGELFDLGFLTEAGVESFERMIVGVCAVFFSFGLLLARVFMKKYAYLSALDAPEAYRQALMADDAFVMALPMWIVAFVTVMVSHSLFPDETDFRVLMALPITKRLIFSTKLLALILFTGLFIVATSVAMAPLFVVTSFGRWAEYPFPFRAAAFGISSVAASVFALLAITAVNGLLVMLVPRGRLMGVSAAFRSTMLCALVVALPAVSLLPAQARRFASGSEWLYLAPPAWFVGLEQILLGRTDLFFVNLAQLAIAGIAIAALLAIGAYAMLYRHFDRVIQRPVRGLERRLPVRISWRSGVRASASNSAYVAIRKFTEITLRRSVLHQGVVVGLSAAGLGLVVNSWLLADLGAWMATGGLPSGGLVSSVIWAPFVLMFAVSLAVRAALVLPIDLRANWMFRLTEQDALRSDQLRAAVHTVLRLGVAVPIALVFPLQWMILGSGAISALMVASLCGLVFVEILMNNWARIPFTCSYIPGKRFVPQSILMAFVAFTLFTAIGSGVTYLSLMQWRGGLMANGILLGIALLLGWRRRRKWSQTPLVFEDQLPTEIHPLQLSVD